MKRPSRCLDPGGARLVELLSVGRIDVAGHRKALRRGDLDQEQHDGARSRCRHGGELAEMLGAAPGHRIRELCEPRLAHEVDVLDLHIAGRTRRVLEQEIDPGAPAISHLAAQGGIADQFFDPSGRERLGGKRIGIGGINADQLGAAAEIDLDQLPAVAELALGIGGLRQPHGRARRREPQHRARIGAVHRQGLACGQRHIGQEPLVAADEGCGDERGGESHGLM